MCDTRTLFQSLVVVRSWMTSFMEQTKLMQDLYSTDRDHDTHIHGHTLKGRDLGRVLFGHDDVKSQQIRV